MLTYSLKIQDILLGNVFLGRIRRRKLKGIILWSTVGGVDFAERMAEIHRELLSLQAESNDLMDTISQNMKEMGL